MIKKENQEADMQVKYIGRFIAKKQVIVDSVKHRFIFYAIYWPPTLDKRYLLISEEMFKQWFKVEEGESK